jgi:HEPN domain-containing protein
LKSCIEKYVSAKNESPPYTHNLTFLAKEAGLYDSMSEAQKDLVDLTEPLNIEARYPMHKGNLRQALDDQRCGEIPHETAELYQWIKRRLLAE